MTETLTGIPERDFRFPWHVVLASASPRRQSLLRHFVKDFETVPAHVDEDALTDMDPWVTAQRLAREKALTVREARPDSLIVAGDTVVAYQDGGQWIQLAKPTDQKDAVRMLSTLSGRTHVVVTGVCLVWPLGMSAFTETTKVTFRTLASSEIEAYVDTGEPMDKAGSYGWQGGAKEFIVLTEGSVTNVVGLPLEKLEETLRSIVRR